MDRDERRARLAQHPNTAKFAELTRVLEDFGWELLRTSSSHHVYGRGSDRMPIPRPKPTMKPNYVRIVLELTEED